MITSAMPKPPLPRPKVFKRVLQGVAAMGVKRIILSSSWRVDKSYWQSPLLTPENLHKHLLLGLEQAWLTERGSALFVIVFTEVWKTTPFMALLLMAGLTLVPEDLLRAARVDGASALQRLFRITLPVMKPAILVALLFRTLDAFRIFDTVFVQTRGAQSTESVSIVGYHTLITRLNLGLGSAVSVLIFACVVIIALLFLKGFGTALARGEGER